MLPLKAISAALVALGVAAGLASYAQQAESQRARAGRIMLSLAESAATMGVTLSKECERSIVVHVETVGFDRGAVTQRGNVLIRSGGVDTWVC